MEYQKKCDEEDIKKMISDGLESAAEEYKKGKEAKKI